MECKVRVLSQQVASQIAAGEVVNRPASVVKELVENAVDAGADSIKVILTDAGRTSIQVIDNGCGMNPEDACTAFERHATSKIKDSDDLYSLTTFGFRGEALPSIAAVAEVQLRTRTADADTGTEITVKASEIESQEACVCPVGSSFTVRNLFYNVPARRKFLKSNQTEFGHVVNEIERVAIAHPEVAIELTHQGEQILSLPVSAVKQRIVNLFGRKMNEALLPVDVETSVVKVSGFCSNLDNVKGKGAKQFSIVAAAAAQAGCTITLRLDSKNGDAIGTVAVKSTGSVEKYKSFSTKVKGATGVHDLYLCFSKATGDVRLDWWTFK